MHLTILLSNSFILWMVLVMRPNKSSIFQSGRIENPIMPFWNICCFFSQISYNCWRDLWQFDPFILLWMIIQLFVQTADHVFIVPKGLDWMITFLKLDHSAKIEMDNNIINFINFSIGKNRLSYCVLYFHNLCVS